MSILQNAKRVCLGAAALVVLLAPFILSVHFCGTDTIQWVFVAVTIYLIPFMVLFLWALGDMVQEAWRLR